MRKILLALAAVLTAAAAPAHAGWYQISNYTGTVGTAPVHVSLQRFDDLDQGQAKPPRVEGSYYYDAHRTPIPLMGHVEADGRMVLCEAALPKSGIESPVVPKASASHPVPCPIALQPTGENAAGEWNDGARKLPIALRRVGRLEDKDDMAPLIEGVNEIPMWQPAGGYLVLGVYRAGKECPLSMLELRLVNIRTGSVDRRIPLDCDAGMIMTSIYENVTPLPFKKTRLIVSYRGGKMGFDQEVDFGQPRAVKRK